MSANGVHETASAAGTSTLTLIAPTDDGEIRFSDAYGVGEVVPAMIKSQSSDKWEEGYYKVAASDTLERTLPTRTWNGTTLDTSPASALDFGTENVDVWVTPVSGGVRPMLSQVASVGVKALSSAHVADGNDNQTMSVLADRVVAIPYIPKKPGEIDGIREEITTAAGTKYRLSIRTSNPTTGLPDTELWQSGDLTPAVSITSTAISPVVNLDGQELWILLLADDACSWRAFNRAACSPTQAGVSASNMRNIQSLFDDITSGWSSIPASGSLTWGALEGSSAAIHLEYV